MLSPDYIVGFVTDSRLKNVCSSIVSAQAAEIIEQKQLLRLEGIDRIEKL
jgi:uncharacterized protein (DUF305 family)